MSRRERESRGARRPEVGPARPSDNEIDQEIEHHLEGRIEELMEQGYDRGAAEREARRRFGATPRVRRQVRAVYRRRRPLGAIGAEVVGALRSLGRRPLFTATAVLLLAIGIGTTSAMVALLDAYLFRDLPYPHADRLVRLQRVVPEGWRGSGPEPVDWSDTPAVELAVSWDLDAFTLVGDGPPQQVPGAWVPPDFFPAFGVALARGRGFRPDEARIGAPVAIIGHELWQTRYGGDPDILGRTVRMYASDRPEEASELTIVGVLPADFWHFNSYTQILAPLPGLRATYIVRLADGVGAEAAQASMLATARESWGPGFAEWGLELADMHDAHVARVRPTLGVLAAAVGLVLLITCSNVAMLMLVQASSRTREYAVRAALGADGSRLMTQQLLEAGLLGAGGAVLGLFAAARALAAWAPAIEQQLGTRVPGGALRLDLDVRVVVVSAGVTLLVTLLFGIAPTVAGLGRDLSRTLTGSGRSSTGTRKQQRVRTGLIVVELALSLALLVGAGLALRSVLYLSSLDPGFEPRGVIQVQMGLSSFRYPSPEDWNRRIEEVLELARATGHVDAAAAALPGPFSEIGPDPIVPLDGPLADADEPALAAIRAISPDYFRTLGIPLLQGRGFAGSDRSDGEPVAIVSERLAAVLWPGERALGRSLQVPDPMGASPEGLWHRVVGVVGETLEGVHAESQAPDAYVPLAQAPRRYAYLHLRTAQPPALFVPVLEEAVWARDPEQPLTGPVLMTDLLRNAGATPRALARLLASFAGFGALLAVVGVYSVVAFAARQRRRELAVRVALGADRRAVRTLVLRHGALVVGSGLALGLLAAWGLARALASQVYGIGSFDPWTFVTVTALLGAIAFAGVLAPARRAAGADPMLLLREE